MKRDFVKRSMVVVLVLCISIGVAVGTVFALGERVFNELIVQLDQAPFGNDKLVILRAATEGNTFTCQQVIQILRTFDFATDQLNALQVVANRIENPEEKESIIEVFAFQTDREKAKEMLNQIKPIQLVPSIPPDLRPENGGYAALIQKLKQENLGSKKLKILAEEIATLAPIPAEQVRPVLSTFDFDSDRVKAVQILDYRVKNLLCKDLLAVLEMFHSSADRLVVLQLLSDALADGENKFILFDAFPYSADRTKAKQILEGVQATHPLFGPLKAKRILFVIDASGSMNNPVSAVGTNGAQAGGSKFQYLQKAVALALRDHLPKDAAFNMILCTSQMAMFTSGLAKVTAGNVEKAVTFVQQAKATDGMPFVDIMTQIMRYTDVDAIYFITDGMISPTERTPLERMVPEMQRWYQKRKIDFYPVVLLQSGDPREIQEFAKSYFRKLADVTSGVAYITVQ